MQMKAPRQLCFIDVLVAKNGVIIVMLEMCYYSEIYKVLCRMFLIKRLFSCSHVEVKNSTM